MNVHLLGITRAGKTEAGKWPVYSLEIHYLPQIKIGFSSGVIGSMKGIHKLLLIIKYDYFFSLTHTMMGFNSNPVSSVSLLI